MIRIGFLGVAHLHAHGYAHALSQEPDVEMVGVWDRTPEVTKAFSERWRIDPIDHFEGVMERADAVIIASENASHYSLGQVATTARKPVLCEKPLVTRVSDGQEWVEDAERAGVPLMTAFPCRYSPAFGRVRDRVQRGDLGPVRAIAATNRGRCPMGWFVDPELAGGGAMIDHTVHVVDLLRVMLASEVVRVQAQIGNNLYGESWDDTAMLTLEFANGIFATLDSSWSRGPGYKTWGDVTMNVVGERAVAEVDLFGQELDLYRDRHEVSGFGSDLDRALVRDFLAAVRGEKPVAITGRDGLAAVKVALAGYESARTRSVVELA